MDKLDALGELIAEEAKRRGMLVNATCRACGDTFLEQSVEHVLAHTKVCEARKKS